MIIKINETVKISEFAEIYVAGNNDSDLSVEFTFSKEALLGFATNLIWMYEDINPNKKIHMHIDPLLGDVPGNQSLGFFLTPKSPSMVLNVNGLNDSGMSNMYNAEYKELFIKHKFIKEFEVKEPAQDECIEEYELGFNNIANIRILDVNGLDTTNERMQVIFNISYNGLRDFAHMLLILANNYENQQKFIMAHVKQEEKQYNLGVLLSSNSNEVVIKCDYLGGVYNFDPHFGQR